MCEGAGILQDSFGWVSYTKPNLDDARELGLFDGFG